jgi:hypothetical protein
MWGWQEVAIFDFGCFPAVAGRAHARIFNYLY